MNLRRKKPRVRINTKKDSYPLGKTECKILCFSDNTLFATSSSMDYYSTKPIVVDYARHKAYGKSAIEGHIRFDRIINPIFGYLNLNLAVDNVMRFYNVRIFDGYNHRLVGEHAITDKLYYFTAESVTKETK